MTDREAADEFDVPALEAMGRRGMRAAVWRGVFRTAIIAVLVLIIGNGTLELAAKGWQNRGDHDTRFFDVVSHALVAANPGYVIEGSLCCTPGKRFDLSFEVGLRPIDLGRQKPQVNIKVRQDWRGHIVDIDGYPSGDEWIGTTMFLRQSRTREQVRAVLEGMPATSTVIAVANLSKPLRPATSDFLIKGPTARTYFLEQVLDPSPKGDEVPFPNSFAFSWPVQYMRDLKPWADRLQQHDQRNLIQFSVSQVKKVANHPQVHAVLYERMPPAQLLALMDRPEVAQLTIIDAALDIDPDVHSTLLPGTGKHLG